MPPGTSSVINASIENVCGPSRVYTNSVRYDSGTDARDARRSARVTAANRQDTLIIS